MLRIMLQFLWALSVIIPSISMAKIVEIEHLTELKAHIKPSTLLIFDIDNTVMEAKQEMGRDQWFRYRMKHYLEQNMSKKEALELALAEWSGTQFITEMHLVESGMDVLIKELQDEGLTVMGLTTRCHWLASRTLVQLDSLNVDLNRTAPQHEDLFFENGKHCLYKKGILFTSGTHKGKAFDKLLGKLNMKPDHVVFINDRIKPLKSIDAFCANNAIPFLGLRYSITDARIKNMRTDLADIQFEKFKNILTDAEAEKLLESKENSSSIK